LIKIGRTCYWYGGTERYRKSSGCSGRRKETERQAETKLGNGLKEDATQKLVVEKLEEC